MYFLKMYCPSDSFWTFISESVYIYIYIIQYYVILNIFNVLKSCCFIYITLIYNFFIYYLFNYIFMFHRSKCICLYLQITFIGTFVLLINSIIIIFIIHII